MNSTSTTFKISEHFASLPKIKATFDQFYIYRQQFLSSPMVLSVVAMYKIKSNVIKPEREQTPLIKNAINTFNKAKINCINILRSHIFVRLWVSRLGQLSPKTCLTTSFLKKICFLHRFRQQEPCSSHYFQKSTIMAAIASHGAISSPHILQQKELFHPINGWGKGGREGKDVIEYVLFHLQNKQKSILIRIQSNQLSFGDQQ